MGRIDGRARFRSAHIRQARQHGAVRRVRHLKGLAHALLRFDVNMDEPVSREL